jgi:sugar/nucleoside kinase (ribokinase family)
LNNFELVRKKREHFQYLVANHVDLLFANEEEIKALLDTENLDDIEKKLDLPQAIVKLGKNGSLLITPPLEKVTAIPPAPTENVKDTTGAGDFYAAGYFFGQSKGLSL